MKKMIAILALCAFVSVSSAAIMFQTESLTVTEGSTFAINVIADGATSALSINALTLTGAASWSGNAVPGFVGGTVAQAGQVAAANTGNVILTTINGTAAAGVTLSAGTVLFTINVKAGAAGSQIVIGDYLGSRTAIGLPTGPNFATRWNAAVATLNDMTVGVVAVPEPITMALLGLGGLFIRRRHA